MSRQMSSPGNCCTPCDETVVINTPGAQGPAGTNGVDGTDGISAFTTTTGFVQPAVNATVNITVANSSMAALGSDIFVEGGGYYQVTAIPDATHITLENLGYTANSAPASVIANASRVVIAGERGLTGDVNANGALLIANDLSDLNNSDTALNNLGMDTVGSNIAKLTNPSAITFIRINADNTVTARSAANFQADLSLVPGTNVQAFDTDLTAIAALVSAADRVPYATGAGTWAIATLTGFARTILDDADAAAGRATLGVISSSWAIYQNQQAAGVNGGTFNNGAWQTVPLNTEVIDVGGIGAVAANIVTLIAGTYRFRGRVIANAVDGFQSRLYNVDTAAVIAYGECVECNPSSKVSETIGRFTVAIATQVRLEAQCATSVAASGFGLANAFGGTQVYSSLEFWKE